MPFRIVTNYVLGHPVRSVVTEIRNLHPVFLEVPRLKQWRSLEMTGDRNEWKHITEYNIESRIEWSERNRNHRERVIECLNNCERVPSVGDKNTSHSIQDLIFITDTIGNSARIEMRIDPIRRTCTSTKHAWCAGKDREAQLQGTGWKTWPWPKHQQSSLGREKARRPRTPHTERCE